MFDAILEDNEALRSAIGRPRTAIFIGGARGAELAEERGARVVRDDPSADGPFDLAVVAASDKPGELATILRGVVPRVGEGGHVVVDHGHGRGTEGAIAALRGARLEPLWRHRPFAAAPWSLSVARRHPEQRKLSLTVGMISMNEAGAVAGMIDAIRKHAPEAEILLVDSSKDETPVIAESKGARVIRQVPPRGYGPAMTRLLYSTTTDVLVTADCDGTYPADRILELHGLIESGMDIVNATRTHHRPDAMALENYVANRAFALAAAAVHGFWTTDLHTGMRAYRTSMLRAMFVEEKAAALPVELLLVPVRHGYRVRDIPIDYFDRVGTTTLNKWDSTKWTFRRIVSAARTGGTKLT
ncbi:MAG TPA: glycosyltransferase [Polyangiaceae bacterium]|jgi:hypothetical protein|nr:glycosyltransferase [Polyangiaceae bacterium]